MATIGTVLDTEIIENIDGDEPVRMLKMELDSAEDVQSVELMSQNGEQTNPLNDSIAAVIEVTPTWKVAISSCDLVAPDDTLEQGEKKIYSLDENNDPIARVFLRNDGIIRIENNNGSVEVKADGTIIHNDGTDWVTQFTAMKSAFDQLVSDFNALVSAYNSHDHISACTAGGSPTNPTLTTGTSSSADMSSAKVETVQVP